MINFENFLTEAAASKDRHLTHIEDAILEGGVNGTRNAIQYLIALRDMFAGDHKQLAEMTRGGYVLRTKFDGAPALYCGINPENGKFFVGTKGVFAKTGAKMNYTNADIDRNHPGPGLNSKLKIALKYMPELGIKGIVHGDFMYTREDLKHATINGVEYITFQPNTITYAVPVNSPIAARIRRSHMGIVFHTTYHGETMGGLQTHFDVNIGNFHQTSNVWFRENSFTDATGKANLTHAENVRLTALLAQAGKLFHTIPAGVLNELSSNETYRIPMMATHNQKVRAGQHITNTAAHVNDIIKYVEGKYDRLAGQVKTPAAKQKRMTEKRIVVRWFKTNAATIQRILELQNLIIDAKMIVIRKLNQVQDMGTFIRSGDGYKVTAPEGFVFARLDTGEAVKLVDRLEFSMTNFTAEKDWK